MILIIGASSYIGRQIYEFFGPSRALGTFNNNPVPAGIFFDARRMQLNDILPKDQSFTHALIMFAETGLDACKADQQRSHDLNVSSTKSVIEDLLQKGTKPIFFSSDYVFDGEKGGYTETDTPNPVTVYGSQKLEIERYLSQRCNHYTVLRLAKVFGTDPEDGTIFSTWLKQILENEEIWCARDQFFSPVHVDNVVAAAAAVIRLNLDGVYHIANSRPWNRVEMVNTLLGCLGMEAWVVECSIGDFNFLDNRPLDLSMKPAKLLEATGLELMDVRSCCETLVRRFRSLEPSPGIQV